MYGEHGMSSFLEQVFIIKYCELQIVDRDVRGEESENLYNDLLIIYDIINYQATKETFDDV